MARMYPERLPLQVDSPAEREVYGLFRDRLPGEYVVLHGVRWLSLSRSHDPQDGEADFVVAHPKLGVLVIEAKGGALRRAGSTGEWYSRDQHGVEHPIKDPFQQATRSMHALLDKCHNTPLTSAYHYYFGHAVAFPDVQVGRVYLGPDTARDIVLDEERLQDPRAAVDAALRFWNRDSSGPGPDALQALIRLLAPSYGLEVTLRTHIDEEERVFRELTEQQFTVLQVLSSYPRALIDGGAGSGKTLLAVEKARRLAQEGFRTLFVCFNRGLARWAAELLGSSTSVEVRTFHDFCAVKAKEAGIQVPDYRPGPAPPELFDETLPGALLDARQHLKPGYDAIVVDEGQDFEDHWWVPLLAWLEDAKNGVLYIFKDDNQRLFRRGREYPIDLPPLRLSVNCRNTKQIHDMVSTYWRGDVAPSCAGPDGTDVEIIDVPPEKSQGALRRVVHRLVVEEGARPREIVVLTPKNAASSRWTEGQQLGNLTLTWQSPPGPNCILCASIPSFKGLEAPVVILTEIERIRPEVHDEELYVATSRARSHLVIIGSLEDIRPQTGGRKPS